MLLRQMTHALHVMALALWCGSLVASGVAAAAVFPAMKQLNPTLPGFAAYTGDHWMLAAGIIADRVFAIADAIQFVTALLACVTMLVAPVFLAAPWRRGVFMLRACLLGGAFCTLSYQLFVLGPRMQVALRAYWAAAQSGDNPAAALHQAAFSADHPAAQLTLVSTALLTLGALFFAAFEREPAAGRDDARTLLRAAS